MSLTELTVENLRCIEKAELQFGPGTQLLFGANGAGKTSILEAVFLLGRGRSFRTRLNERLVRHGQTCARSVGKVSGDPLNHHLGIEIQRSSTGSGTIGRLDGAALRSFAEAAIAFPVQVMDPEAHKLIEESSARRRRWLDWVVFHVEPGFAPIWGRYQRALAQRNAALRAGLADIGVWDPELAREGEIITAARARAIEALRPRWEALCQELVGVEVSLAFQPGWDQDLALAVVLERTMGRDRERRSTLQGPHRADVVLRVRGRPAREVLSRGQQKLTAVALTLCQLEFLKHEYGLSPTVLLDDPSAELDQERLAYFIRRVQALETQIVVTALERDYRLFGEPERVFHVEQGRVIQV
jgi:DNA replication and repair protein RecF